MGSQTYQLSVLFVCFGNICRSPMAEGLFRHYLDSQGLSDVIRLDSAGTHCYLRNEPPTRDAQQATRQRGVDISALRSRILTPDDLEEFDMLLVMDQRNLRDISRQSSTAAGSRCHLLADYHPEMDITEIPDPYGEELRVFHDTAELLEQCFPGLTGEIRQKLAGLNARDR